MSSRRRCISAYLSRKSKGMTLDYLIVGQGLAGTALAAELLKRGKKFMVIDRFRMNSSSLVATGLINPVIARNLNMYWKADYFLPHAEKSFRQMEKFLGESFYTPLDMLRIFRSDEEREKLRQRLEKHPNPYVGRFREELPPGLKGRHGAAPIRGVAYLELKTLLPAMRQYLRNAGILLEEYFQYDKLLCEGPLLQYGLWESERIIFAEGPGVLDNPWFPDLPFAFTKGELLTLEIEGGPQNTVISKGHNLVPIGGNRYKFGATYAWDFEDARPTPEARALLEERLQELLTLPYAIRGQEAGIRPTVRDRKPLLGTVSSDPRIAIFNGLGSHGAIMAPALARDLMDYLEKDKALMKEVLVHRQIKAHNS